MSNLKKLNAALARQTNVLCTEDIIVDPEGTIRIEMNNGVATGVKDTPEAAETEVVEAEAEVDEAVEDAEETEAAMEGLKILADELECALAENGGLTVEESDILTKEYLDLLARAKVSAPLCPSMESYGINDFHREEATKLLRQNVVLSTESLLDKTIKVLKIVWEKIKEAFGKLKQFLNSKLAKLKEIKRRMTSNYTSAASDVVAETGTTITIFPEAADGVLDVTLANDVLASVAGIFNDKASPNFPNVFSSILFLTSEKNPNVLSDNFELYNRITNEVMSIFKLKKTLPTIEINCSVDAIAVKLLDTPGLTAPIFRNDIEISFKNDFVKDIKLNKADIRNGMGVNTDSLEKIMTQLVDQLSKMTTQINSDILRMQKQIDVLLQKQINASDSELKEIQRNIEENLVKQTFSRKMIALLQTLFELLTKWCNNLCDVVLRTMVDVAKLHSKMLANESEQ